MVKLYTYSPCTSCPSSSAPSFVVGSIPVKSTFMVLVGGSYRIREGQSPAPSNWHNCLRASSTSPSIFRRLVGRPELPGGSRLSIGNSKGLTPQYNPRTMNGRHFDSSEPRLQICGGRRT